jgi:hypothetical protein
MRRNKKWSAVIASIALLVMPATSMAQSSSSTNYKVDQTFFGSGGELNACSSGPEGYCSKQTAGELSVGETCSAGYCAYAGFNTTDDPFIEFVVTADNIDLGYLSTSTATTATGTFYVRAWQAQGYVVTTESDPPTNTSGGHEITPLGSPTGSTTGSEQFGINLVNNASPDVGDDPQPGLAPAYSHGEAYPGYDSPDNFKYNKGDIIARSQQSSSSTIYTISYLFNIDETTPAGQYVFKHTLVATGTY